MADPILAGIAEIRDLDAVQITPCTLRVGQILGYQSFDEGDVLMEYLGTGRMGYISVDGILYGN